MNQNHELHGRLNDREGCSNFLTKVNGDAIIELMKNLPASEYVYYVEIKPGKVKLSNTPVLFDQHGDCQLGSLLIENNKSYMKTVFPTCQQVVYNDSMKILGSLNGIHIQKRSVNNRSKTSSN